MKMNVDLNNLCLHEMVAKDMVGSAQSIFVMADLYCLLSLSYSNNQDYLLHICIYVTIYSVARRVYRRHSRYR